MVHVHIYVLTYNVIIKCEHKKTGLGLENSESSKSESSVGPDKSESEADVQRFRIVCRHNYSLTTGKEVFGTLGLCS
jgi:hypothetical protein